MEKMEITEKELDDYVKLHQERIRKLTAGLEEIKKKVDEILE